MLTSFAALERPFASEPDASVRPPTALSRSPEMPSSESRMPETVFLSSLDLTENVES